MEYIALVLSVAAVAAVWTLYIHNKRMQEEFRVYLNDRQSEFNRMLNDLVDVIAQALNAGLETMKTMKQNDMRYNDSFDMKTDAGHTETARTNTSRIEKPSTEFSEVLRQKTAAAEAAERSVKRLKAEEMIEEGIPAGEIAKRLKLGTGEIELIGNFIKKSREFHKNN